MIIRVHKEDHNILTVDKTCSMDSRLSWKARGIHHRLMCMDDCSDITIEELVSMGTEGKSSVSSGMKELMQYGYVIRKKTRNKETGKFKGYEYVIHEVPKKVKKEEEKPEKVKVTWKSLRTEYEGKYKIAYLKASYFYYKGLKQEGVFKTIDEKKVIAGARCITKLVLIDGYSLIEILDALQWGLSDSFWRDHVLHIGTLRRVSKHNNKKKFENLFNQMKRNGHTRQKKSNTKYDGVGEGINT
jgi:predicted transcriptional regulator